MKALSFLVNFIIYLVIPFIIVGLLSLLMGFDYLSVTHNTGFMIFLFFYFIFVVLVLITDYETNTMYFFKFKE